MDYNINEFVSNLRQKMYHKFPYENNDINRLKHKGRTFNIRDVAFMNNPLQVLSEDMIVFDIGNEFSEKYYPYYHILEDSPVIHKKDRGTKESKGSQNKVKNMGQRDYGKVGFNGKIYSQEYRKLVGEERERAIGYSQKHIKLEGRDIKVNTYASTYQNIHYHYIENMLLLIAPIIAEDFGMKYMGQSDNGLIEEYIMQESSMPNDDVTSVIQVLNM